jgi:hypothetical protein
MKIPFKRDPAGILLKVQGELAAVEAKKAELESKRAAALVEVDADVSEIAAIEDQIEFQRCAIAVHHARVGALQGELRAQRREARAREYAAQLATVRPRLEELVTISKKIDAALSGVATSYAALTQRRDAVLADWPDGILPRPSHEALRFGIHREFDWLRYCLDHPPTLDNAGGGFEPSVAAGVETEVRGVIAELETAALPEDDDEDPMQEQAA